MTLAEELATRGTTRAAVDLSALVRESLTADAAREVLQLRFDGLAPALRRPQQRRQLRGTLQAALGAVRAQIFDLPNGDIVTVARPPGTVLDGAEAALRARSSAASASSSSAREALTRAGETQPSASRSWSLLCRSRARATTASAWRTRALEPSPSSPHSNSPAATIAPSSTGRLATLPGAPKATGAISASLLPPSER
jgi:hypothetical protein